MAARTGAQYKAGLDDGREVWLGEGRVAVASDPVLKGSINGMAGYFDWQHQYADECLIDDPERPGEKMNVSLMLPKCREDLAVRHRGLERLARYSNGMLGRTPDYVNVVLAGHTARADVDAAARMAAADEAYDAAAAQLAWARDMISWMSVTTSGGPMKRHSAASSWGAKPSATSAWLIERVMPTCGSLSVPSRSKSR